MPRDFSSESDRAGAYGALPVGDMDDTRITLTIRFELHWGETSSPTAVSFFRKVNTHATVCSGETRRASQLLDEKLEIWRTRPLGAIPYLVLDARYEKVLTGCISSTWRC